jgi:hypothetical protein
MPLKSEEAQGGIEVIDKKSWRQFKQGVNKAELKQSA